MSLFKLARLGEEVAELREQRALLVSKVRELANKLSDPEVPRIFTDEDFSS
jgi:hypothetical protein